MDTPDVVKLFIDAGVAVLLGTGLVIVWKTWRAAETTHQAALDQQAADYQSVVDHKNTVIEKLAEQIENVTTQANTRLDRMVQMIADGGTATQSVLADNAAAMAVNQQVLQDVKNELQQLRNTVDRIRGGGS